MSFVSLSRSGRRNINPFPAGGLNFVRRSVHLSSSVCGLSVSMSRHLSVDRQSIFCVDTGQPRQYSVASFRRCKCHRRSRTTLTIKDGVRPSEANVGSRPVDLQEITTFRPQQMSNGDFAGDASWHAAGQQFYRDIWVWCQSKTL